MLLTTVMQVQDSGSSSKSVDFPRFSSSRHHLDYRVSRSLPAQGHVHKFVELSV